MVPSCNSHQNRKLRWLWTVQIAGEVSEKQQRQTRYGCKVRNVHNSPRSARLSAVHKLFTSCIARGLVSRDSIVDGDWLLATEWCQSYLPCCQPASDVAENLGRFLTGQGNDFKLISMVKMETINPVEGYFGSEFPAICNQWGVMAVVNSQKTLKSFENFMRSLEKRPLSWLNGTMVERKSVTGELSLSYARPAVNGWPLMCVNHPL